jgi:hypothetical protein
MPDYRDFSDSAFGLIDEHFCSHKIPSLPQSSDGKVEKP